MELPAAAAPRPTSSATSASASVLAAVLVERLASRGASVATAESLTGGRLAAGLTAVPGASAVFLGGVVSYATRVKVNVLGVPADVVERHGVISAECAEAMATAARTLLGSTWALGTTGVAGPDLQEGQPAGTVFVGIAGPDGSRVERLALVGSRAEIQDETCRRALALLSEALGASGDGDAGE